MCSCTGHSKVHRQIQRTLKEQGSPEAFYSTDSFHEFYQSVIALQIADELTFTYVLLLNHGFSLMRN